MVNSDLIISPKKMRSYIDSRVNKVLKDKDYTASQIPFIMAIGKNGGVSLKDLCTCIGADKGLTTRVIQALMQNGLVENRSESARTYNLYLTEKGQRAFDESEAAMDGLLDQIFACLEEDEKEQLRKISAKINQRLDELYEY